MEAIDSRAREEVHCVFTKREKGAAPCEGIVQADAGGDRGRAESVA